MQACDAALLSQQPECNEGLAIKSYLLTCSHARGGGGVVEILCEPNLFSPQYELLLAGKLPLFAQRPSQR
jgi:hypothetical protein